MVFNIFSVLTYLSLPKSLWDRYYYCNITITFHKKKQKQRGEVRSWDDFEELFDKRALLSFKFLLTPHTGYLPARAAGHSANRLRLNQRKQFRWAFVLLPWSHQHSLLESRDDGAQTLWRHRVDPEQGDEVPHHWFPPCAAMCLQLISLPFASITSCFI